MQTNILVQNLSEVVSDFDVANGVTMVSPNNWSSAKHGLRGYSTARQLRNAIKRKTDKQPTQPFRWKLTNGKFVHPECREAYQANKAKGGNRPGIESAVYEGFSMSRFELCAHCNVPVWDRAA